MKRLTALLLATIVVALCGCHRGSAPVRIGSKNFSEQIVLAEIVAQALEAKGLRVDRKFNLGGTFVCHKALVAGDLDLYPEYTGTAYTAILEKKPVSDPAAVRADVARE
jgi:glycine betaine/choline ABC-type transport system substrate-binding protein